MFETNEVLVTRKDIIRATKGREIRLSVGEGFATVTQKSLIEFAEKYGRGNPLIVSRMSGDGSRMVWVYAKQMRY